jgi:hypothetical protein
MLRSFVPLLRTDLSIKMTVEDQLENSDSGETKCSEKTCIMFFGPERIRLRQAPAGTRVA